MSGLRQNRLPPGPKPLPLLGNIVDFLRLGPDLFETSARTYGDITTVSFGDRKHFIINDPNLIRQVLVRDREKFEKGRALSLARRSMGAGLLTTDGDAYRKQRRAAQPAFNIKNMPDFAETVTRFLERLHARWQDGFEFDLMDEMTGLCINIAAETFLGVDVSAAAHEIGQVFDETMAALNTLNLLPPFAESLPLPVCLRLKRLKKRLGAIANDIIQQRKRITGRPSDLLSLILAQAANDAEGFSAVELQEQVITFLFAGYEAPCKALFWTWYLLGREESGRVEQSLLEELDRVLGGRAPTIDDVPELRYTRAVVSEALRLYPPAWIIARKVIEPYEVGEFTLPAGHEIFMSPYITQRDARFFPDPLAFKPERWLESDGDRPQFAFFPFGGGLRGCSGVHFAWPQMILIVATIAQSWRIELTSRQEVKPNPAFTFGPSTPIRAVSRRRVATVRPQARSAIPV